jgi:hypothetical protein
VSIIKLFNTISATSTLSSVSVDIQKDGMIYCVTLGVGFTEGGLVGLSNVVQAELSFGSATTFATHDVRQSICHVVGTMVPFTTTPVIGLPSVPFCVLSAVEIPVEAGERLFLHLQSSSAALDTATAIGYLFIRDGAEKKRTVRRA